MSKERDRSWKIATWRPTIYPHAMQLFVATCTQGLEVLAMITVAT